MPANTHLSYTYLHTNDWMEAILGMDNIPLQKPIAFIDQETRSTTPPRPVCDQPIIASSSRLEESAFLCPGQVFLGHQAFATPSSSKEKERSTSRRPSRNTVRHAVQDRQRVEQVTHLRNAADGSPYRILLSRIFGDDGQEPAEGQEDSSDEEMPPLISSTEVGFYEGSTHQPATAAARHMSAENRSFWDYQLSLEHLRRSGFYELNVNQPVPAADDTQTITALSQSTAEPVISLRSRRLSSAQGVASDSGPQPATSALASSSSSSSSTSTSPHRRSSRTSPPSVQGDRLRLPHMDDVHRYEAAMSKKIAKNREQWDVKIFITTVDWSTGHLTGIMEAQNVPRAPDTVKVVTNFVGEIVDGVNHSMFRPAQPWQSSADYASQRRADQNHWSQLKPFAHLSHQQCDKQSSSCVAEAIERHRLIQEGCYNSGQDGWLLMRWKEGCFINLDAAQCSLTIAGFYYVGMSRKTGELDSVYLDPVSTPFQRLGAFPASCLDQPATASFDIV